MSVPVDSVDLDRLFRRGFAATFALDLVTKALAAATVVVLIRGLSVSSYAFTTLFLTFAALSGAAAAGGVRTLYLREEAERVSRAGTEVVSGAFVDSLVKGILLIVVFGICAVPIADTVGYGSSFGTASLILYSSGFAIGFSAIELAIVHYQAGRHFFTAGVLSVLRALTLLGASLAITTTGQSVLVVSLSFIASIAAVGVISAGRIARRSMRLPRLSLLKREEMWLSFYSVGAAGFAYVDVMVAGALLDEHQVATLGASLRYLAIVLGAIPALAAILRVRTSQFDLIDSPANQRAMVIGWIRRATLPTALLIGSAVLLAPVVLPEIDRGRYPGSVEALQIFLVTAFSAYLTAPAANVLMAQRQYGTLTSIYALGLLLNLVGDIAVAPRFGVVGIAIVSSTVYVLIDVAMVVWSVAFASRTRAGRKRSVVGSEMQMHDVAGSSPPARPRAKGQMRILICSEQAPLPPPTGVRLVVRALVRELSRRHEVRVLCFGPTDQEGRGIDCAPTRMVANSEPLRRNVVVRLSRAIVTGRPTRVDDFERAMRTPLEEELKSFNPDVLHVTTGLLAGLGRQLAGRPTVLVPLDAAYKMVEAQALEFAGVRRRLLLAQAERMRRFEADEYARFRHVVVVTERDRDALRALDPALTVDVIPNGVDAEFFTPLPFEERRRTVVFHGVMNFAPNVRAAEYLAKQVWPNVQRRRPNAQLKIVGRAPVRKIRALAAIDGVEVTGEVEDVRPWLRHGRVYACPMLTGTGIKNKLLEAMASGMACVATPLALSGMRAVPGRDLMIAEGAEALAAQIVRLLDDDDLAAQLGQAAREYVRTEHDWSAVARAYERVYEAAIRETPDQTSGAKVVGATG